MPASTLQRPVAHRQINFLSEQFLSQQSHPLSTPDGISNEALSKYQIHLTPFDFETLEDEDVNLSMDPPVLFHPLPLSVLQEHPIVPEELGDEREQDEQMIFRDYEPSEDDGSPHSRDENEEHRRGLRSFRCAREVHRYLYNWSSRFPRSGVIGLHGSLQLRKIRLPNPFFHGINPSRYSFPAYTNWTCQPLFETKPEGENTVPTNARVILITMISSYGKENSIQIGELSSIIAMMHNRLVQPMTYGEEDEEKFFDIDEENVIERRDEIRLRPCTFEKENRFPVLMISCLGPQHGRLFYACMDDEKLMIRQSKLYSFEKKSTAPWDFFSRFILSRPLKESA